MNWLENLLTPALVRAVGYTILHSLWQGGVVALALAGLLLVLRRHSAQVRYRVTAGALGLVLLLAAVTFVRYYATALPVAGSAAAASVVAGVAAEAAPGTVSGAAIGEGPLSPAVVLRYLEHHLPLLVALWLLGLLTMTLRLLGGLAYVQRLRHYGTRPLGQHWQDRLEALAARAGLRRSVQLLESSLVRVPVVVGHLKPLILLPLGAVAGLSGPQLEAILAHELAHVARRDYLINLLQSVAEVLFFYHPAMWFLTGTLRTERENCCDDVAASLCGDPLVLARALAALAALGLEHTAAPRLSLAATGPRGSLLGRVRRLVQGRTAPTFTEGFMAACVVMVGLLLLSFTAAAALANPRLAEAPRRLRDQVLRPFMREVVAPIAVPADVPEPWEIPTRPELENLAAAAEPTSDDPRRKRKKAASSQVVVVDGAGRRGEPGTVVIEKDKKGRVTDLYVNGQRVEASAPAGKGADGRTQVMRVAPKGQTYTYGGPGDARFYAGPGQGFAGAAFRRESGQLQELPKLDQFRGQGFSYGYGSSGELRTHMEALASAEKALRKAQQSADLSEEERLSLEEALHDVREQRGELQELSREQAEAERDARHDRAERLRELAEARREASQDRHEDQREEHERLRVERERVRVERDRMRVERDAHTRAAEQAFIDALVKDGIIKDRHHFRLTLSAQGLTVDGQKQPAAVAARYRNLYENSTGRTLDGTDTLSMSHNGDNATHRYSNDYPGEAPLPPLPPLPPAQPSRAGRVLPPADAPRAPRPPQAPSVFGRTSTLFGSLDLAEQLRRDGLIGEKDRSYQLRLNATEMVVNGKKQPEETAARYRQLLGGDKDRSVNINVNVDEN